MSGCADLDTVKSQKKQASVTSTLLYNYCLLQKSDITFTPRVHDYSLTQSGYASAKPSPLCDVITTWHNILWSSQNMKTNDLRTSDQCINRHILPKAATYFNNLIFSDSNLTLHTRTLKQLALLYSIQPKLKKCTISPSISASPQKTAAAATATATFSLSLLPGIYYD